MGEDRSAGLLWARVAELVALGMDDVSGEDWLRIIAPAWIGDLLALTLVSIVDRLARTVASIADLLAPMVASITDRLAGVAVLPAISLAVKESRQCGSS